MQSFDEMFALYFGRVYRFALSLTRSTAMAEDITQQTFFKALKKIDSFEGRSDPGTWLCSIAKNKYFTMKKAGQGAGRAAGQRAVFEACAHGIMENARFF